MAVHSLSGKYQRVCSGVESQSCDLLESRSLQKNSIKMKIKMKMKTLSQYYTLPFVVMLPIDRQA